MFQQALALQQQGKLEEAARAYETILSARPDDRDALIYFGVLRLSQSRAADAEALLRRAVEAAPEAPAAHANLAAALQALGRLEQAAIHYQRAVDLRPDLIDAYFGLAACLQGLGRFDAAVASYQAIIATEPGHPEANFGLGTLLANQKQADQAVICYRAALAADPDFAEANVGLGNVLSERDEHEAAITCFSQALDVDPDYTEARLGLAAALGRVGREQEAAAIYNAILGTDPCDPAAHAGLGFLASQREDHPTALLSFDRALAADPTAVAAINGKAAALLSLQRHPEAIALCQEALRLDPASAVAYNLLGMALSQIGQFDESRAALSRAAALEPGRPGILLNLVQTMRIKPGDPVLEALQTLASRAAALCAVDQCALHFALAKTLTDIGDPETGFSHLLQGNAIKRKLIQYDERPVFQMMERVRAVFDRGLLSARGNRGAPSDVPVFVMGMPRSGTTLVEQILASHPDVFGAGELSVVPVTFARLNNPVGGLGFPEAVWSMKDQEFRALGEALLAELLPKASGASRIVDKGLGSFVYVGLIHLCLPGARIIRLKRDPVDTCLSNFSKLFTKGQDFTYDLGELGRYYRALEALLDHWQDVLPPGVMLDVRYEDLVDDVESGTRRILAHCGLPWNDACLSFYETSRPVQTASVSQVRQPIYRSSVGRWRPDDALIRPLLDALQVH